MHKPRNEHLKASSVLVILGATGEFIKKLPLLQRTDSVCVCVCGPASPEKEHEEA